MNRRGFFKALAVAAIASKLPVVPAVKEFRISFAYKGIRYTSPNCRCALLTIREWQPAFDKMNLVKVNRERLKL